jgi:hypothetical protein
MASVNLIYAPPGPVISTSPEEVIANPGDTFTVDINIAAVTDLYAWEIRLSWKPDLLDFVSVAKGPFLGQGGMTFFASTVDQAAGEALFGETLVGGIPGVSGSGLLATVTFRAEEAGKCDLHFAETALVDSTLTDIPHSAEDGAFATPQEANLVGRSAWPEHRHYVISKDEDAYQTLNAKVTNTGPSDLYVKVVFALTRDDGIPEIVTTDVIVVSPGTKVDVSADFGPLTLISKAKYAAEARCLYSHYGTVFAGVGDKIKTFSFAVVP